MSFKNLSNMLSAQTESIFNKNERLATNVVDNKNTSKFDISSRHLTTFDSGKLVPILCKEILPGDVIDLDMSTLLRLSTPSAATMENAIYDIAFFFIPNRILWNSWKYFMGENKNAGYQSTYPTVPTINYDKTLKYDANDLASYIGIPQNVDMSKIGVPINALFFKAYAQVWNDWYRDQNVQSEIDNTNNNDNDANVTISNYDLTNFHTSIQCGKLLAPTSRLVDYFSTCLPFPQKGDNVNIDSLALNNLFITNDLDKKHLFTPSWYYGDGVNVPLNRPIMSAGGNTTSFGNPSSSITPESTANLSLKIDIDKQNIPYNVNDLRLAISLQHLRELDSRGGTRYIEILLNHFGVRSSDARLQRAEYIGGFRDLVNIDNVIQMSSSTPNSPLGVLGGVSVSGSKTPSPITYASDEHGILMGFITVRPQVNYSQGLDKQFTRIEKYDFYDPLLANIGEQEIKKYELFLSDSELDNTNNVTFGYNEAWADYRYMQNKLTGYMSANNELSLISLYAYSENYKNAPTLSSEWMETDINIIGQTLILNSSQLEYVHQFLADFYFSFKISRKMPIFSIPGLTRI